MCANTAASVTAATVAAPASIAETIKAEPTASITDNDVPPSNPQSGDLSPSANELPPIPGSEVIGRGLYIRPRQPYDLKDFVFNREQASPTFYLSRDSSGSSNPSAFSVPAGCEVNDAPPLPADQSLGHTLIEESWSRFGQELTMDVNASVTSKVFSIDATSFQASSLQSEEDAYYALRSSFIPLWSVYSPKEDTNKVGERLRQLELNLPDGPYNPLYRERYAEVFDVVGTHYVRNCWVGGKASLIFIINKSSNLTKEDVRTGVQAAVSGFLNAKSSEAKTTTQQVFQSNTSCTVFGCGGDSTLLAQLSTLENDKYNLWVNSVKANPEIIQLGVAGIWTLFQNPVKAEALLQAYIQESTFSPLTAIVPITFGSEINDSRKSVLVFTKDDEAFDYDVFPENGRSRVNVFSYYFESGSFPDPDALYKELTNLETAEKSGAGLRSSKGLAQKNLFFSRLAGLNTKQSTAQSALQLKKAPSTPAGTNEPISTTNAIRSDTSADSIVERLKMALNYLITQDIPIYEQADLAALKDLKERAKQQQELAFLINEYDNIGVPSPHLPNKRHLLLLNRRLLEFAFGKSLIVPRPQTVTLTHYAPYLKNDKYSDFVRPHAAFSTYGFGGGMDGYVFMFKWRRYIRINIDNEAGSPINYDYPRNIMEGGWIGVDFDRIDAALAVAPDKVYFFRGSEFVCTTLKNGVVVNSFRGNIKNYWPGVIFDKIDTAIYWGNSKVYFFSNDQYIRFDMATHQADAGYPKFLTSNYVDNWEFFG